MWGAYKKPREATWLVGCILLLMTLAYGLTGYLLPWDNRAYWATMVTTQIMATAPGAGPYLLRLLGSDGGSIGVVTFARFYAVHVLLLPPLTMLLIAIHLILVRRHGVAPAADDNKPKQKFYPKQVFKDTIATFIWFAVLMGMAIVAKVPLGRTADPTDTSFVPRPEWYFLFLFQTVKLFEGPLEIIGTIILPTLAILALLLVPFIDRGKAVTLRQRTGAIALVVLGAIAWSGLTARAVATTPPSNESPDAGLERVEAWQEIPADQLAAVGYFRKDNCASCHVAGKAAAGPDLTVNTSQQTRRLADGAFQEADARLARHAVEQLRNSRRWPPSSPNETTRASMRWPNAPQAAVEGAMVYQTSQCAMCHQLNGAGQKTGPALNGLSDHRARDWVVGHFAEPAKFSPGSVMPAYKFNSQDLDRITSYLMQIPKQ